MHYHLPVILVPDPNTWRITLYLFCEYTPPDVQEDGSYEAINTALSLVASPVARIGRCCVVSLCAVHLPRFADLVCYLWIAPILRLRDADSRLNVWTIFSTNATIAVAPAPITNWIKNTRIYQNLIDSGESLPSVHTQRCLPDLFQ